ncbi:TadE/TadG family type IV pilus assembly protein [Pseudobacteroides cellulosolvens]|uniref:TadE family protein n=1 Tax=Pseudobacteroides cellulosolvens ATCC 35603 = DSM 2933 TaxID=398512 RepID=A0A0L6JGT3_9FIRM|nr:TadE/TadG family type IV pilus assembly protein [Pseudobacteroides cellulosolvens]KNY25071.1 TadE family protein [Pseudobacteroides cellulosolvens ATCC 35603 = DSM 2933]
MIMPAKKRGSLTIEAACALPVVILVVLTIAYFIRVAYIHSIIQHALDESAKEISSYSYLYSVSKLQSLNDSTEDLLTENEATAASRIDTVLETVNSVNDKIGKLGNLSNDVDKFNFEEVKGLYNDGKVDVEKIKGIYNEIRGHPNGWKGGIKKEVASISALVAHGLLESGREELSEIIVRIMMRKHIATDIYDEDIVLKKLNIIGGYDGLDFTGTTLFKDKKTIKIVVSYTIEPITPLPIIPELRIEQKALVVGWLDGDGQHSKRLQNKDEDSKNEDGEEDNLWDLGALARGNEIIRRFGGNVINRTGGAVDIFDVNTGTATNMRSIDVTLSSYSDINKLKKEIVSEVNLTKDYNSKVVVIQNGKKTEFSIKNRNVRIIIPKGTKTAEITGLETELNSGKPGVKLTIEEYIEKRAKES